MPSPERPVTPMFGRFHNVHEEFLQHSNMHLIAIEDISFDLKEGEPSRRGEASFINIVAALVERTNGVVEIRGK